MGRITDALEQLSTQHATLDALLSDIALTTDAEARTRHVDDLAHLLTAHLAIEQEYLYPVIASHVSAGVLAELYAEHGEIKRVLADLLWQDGDDEQFAPTLKQLTILLDGHCAWQDDQLFTPAQAALSQEHRTVMSQQIAEWLPTAAAA
jgi:hemerythrin-like domain-containing protein